MQTIYSLLLFLLMKSFATGQALNIDWYSETENIGIVIQNSYPKGGSYTGPTTEHYNYSYLVFFTRVINRTDESIDLSVHFSADSTMIPNSPNTFMKLFLPEAKMTLTKQRSI